MKTAKEFALEQIAPYYKDPSICGYDGNSCRYITEDGKMCVAGKNMLNPRINCFDSIKAILSEDLEEDVFKPAARGILNPKQWSLLQNIHDSIAEGEEHNVPIGVIELGLFSLEELEEAANKL